jgi:hypothetical protein
MDDLFMVNRWEAEKVIISFVKGNTGKSIVDLTIWAR